MRFACRLLFTLSVLSLAIGCRKSETASSTSASTPPKITLQLNWQPEPEFGGFYVTDAYRDHGLDVNVVPGNGGTPTVQMIGARSVDFGIVSADELVVSRSRGNAIVALLAVYQTNPQGIMTHAARGFSQLADVFANPGTLAIDSGLPYSDFLKIKFGFDKLNIVPSPNGDVTVFLKDPTFSQQCFITSEPLVAKKHGGDPKTFLVADAGFNPYTTVLATSDAYAAAHPDVVKAMTLACRDGWLAYLHDPKPANTAMHDLNPSMDEQTFAEAAEAQRPLIQPAGSPDDAVGAMDVKRWQTLIDQLLALKAIDHPVPAAECFIPPPWK
jgi:NitT/TauT family transport system substrate-binding protein